MIQTFRYTWHQKADKRIFTQRRSQHTQWHCQLMRRWRNWGEDKIFTELSGKRQRVHWKVSEKHKGFSEKDNIFCSQVKLFLLENSFVWLFNIILIRNLSGKRGNDSWVQVMAMHTGSAWKLENSQFDLLCCQANAKGCLNPNVYKIC